MWKRARVPQGAGSDGRSCVGVAGRHTAVASTFKVQSVRVRFRDAPLSARKSGGCCTAAGRAREMCKYGAFLAKVKGRKKSRRPRWTAGVLVLLTAREEVRTRQILGRAAPRMYRVSGSSARAVVCALHCAPCNYQVGNPCDTHRGLAEDKGLGHRRVSAAASPLPSPYIRETRTNPALRQRQPRACSRAGVGARVVSAKGLCKQLALLMQSGA